MLFSVQQLNVGGWEGQPNVANPQLAKNIYLNVPWFELIPITLLTKMIEFIIEKIK